MNDPHKNFRNSRDYKKWENFVDQIDSINLSDADKVRARAAIEYLQNLLGKHFLSEIFQSGHPLVSRYFINAANLARIQLIDFVESLQALEKSLNFHTLVDKIKKARKFSEGAAILETAYKFYRENFSVAFDVKVNFIDGKEQKNKEPDIKITNDVTGEDIYIEVSELRESRMSIDNSRTYDTIWHLIHNEIWTDPELTNIAEPEGILPYVKIHRNLNEKELNETITKIQSLIDLVRKNKKFYELIIKDTIEIGVSPSHDHSEAERWAAERNISNFVESSSFNPNELKRVINRLKEELVQLPKNTPGLVVIWNNSNLLFFLHDPLSIADRVKKLLIDYPNVFGAAFSFNCGWAEPSTATLETDDYLLTDHTGRDLVTRKTLFVRNNSFNLSMTDATSYKLIESFKSSGLEF